MTNTGALAEWLNGAILGKKQPVALMVVGDHASGKTFFARALMERIGSTECRMLNRVPENFNGEMVDKSLVVFDEWQDDLSRLDPYITNSVVEVERKGWTPAEQEFRTNYVLLVRRNPILHGTDRRFITVTPEHALDVLALVKL